MSKLDLLSQLKAKKIEKKISLFAWLHFGSWTNGAIQAQISNDGSLLKILIGQNFWNQINEFSFSYNYLILIHNLKFFAGPMLSSPLIIVLSLHIFLNMILGFKKAVLNLAICHKNVIVVLWYLLVFPYLFFHIYIYIVYISIRTVIAI